MQSEHTIPAEEAVPEIYVNPELLYDEANNINGFREQFCTGLDACQRRVEGLEWRGKSAEAYRNMFSTARQRLRNVEESLTEIAEALKFAAHNLELTDTDAAAATNRML
jgi:WXG100 family type VII secretion target